MNFSNKYSKVASFLLILSLVFSVPTQAAKTEIGLSDNELLETIQEHSFRYFLKEKDKNTGLVYDRAHNHKRGATVAPSSVAATGFALTAYPIGVKHNWIDYGLAYEMTRKALTFMLRHAEHERGFFYHFINPKTGARSGKSEVSPIDTTLFLAGALFAAEYFKEPEIRELVNQLYERVEWDWMLNGGKTLALAWTPEKKFSQYRWDHYSELLIMYLLAIGSPTHPIPASSWDAFRRPVGSYGPYKVIFMPPLFTHQYSHIWVDFRNKSDKYADYFENSVLATKANRQFCIDQAVHYKSYGLNSWGLTASDGPTGYKAYGAPPGWAEHDGTIAPTGCGSSIVFTPQASIDCLRYYYEQLGSKLWGMYGFSDSFNLDKKWYSNQALAIDQGALILMIENYRTEMIWKTMSENTYLQAAMKAVGFEEGTKTPPWPEALSYDVPYVHGGILPDGYLKDWPRSEVLVLDEAFLESGNLSSPDDLKAVLRFAWDEEALYFAAKVRDEQVISRKSGKNIWLDDAVELFFDPDGDGLYWGSKEDYQIGFAADLKAGGVKTWSWFQGGEDPQESRMVLGHSFSDQKGYLIEGMVRWQYIGVDPKTNSKLKFSVSVHDIDSDRLHTKVKWFMRNEKELNRFNLGTLNLKMPEPPEPYEG